MNTTIPKFDIVVAYDTSFALYRVVVTLHRKVFSWAVIPEQFDRSETMPMLAKEIARAIQGVTKVG